MTVRKRPGGLNIEINRNYIDQKGNLKKKLHEYKKTCSKKTRSRQRTIATGKAATFHVRIIRPSTPLLSQTMKGTVILCLYFYPLDSSFHLVENLPNSSWILLRFFKLQKYTYMF